MIYRKFLLLFALIGLVACQDNSKKLNRRITLWRKDKIPYGTFYAFENLHLLFPDAKIRINKSSPVDFFYGRNDFFSEQMQSSNGRKLYVVIAQQVMPDAREINALMNFVANGNILFISSFRLGDSLLAKLGLRTNGKIFYSHDSLGLNIYNPSTYDSLNFNYPGNGADNALGQMDSAYTTILGHDERGFANFVKFGYKGGGAVFIHFAPLAFSNFFLLHKHNKDYYDNVFSYIPLSVDDIAWDDYFRYPAKTNFSALQYIFYNESLRWAFWLTILLFFVVYFIESKRRQRMIPSRPVAANSTLDFVKTVGRLYYQRRDNGNLAAKIGAHFLEYVRSHYNLSTAALDEEFVNRLAYKSGFDKTELQGLVNNLTVFQDHVYISDDLLMEFNDKIESFYKQNEYGRKHFSAKDGSGRFAGSGEQA